MTGWWFQPLWKILVNGKDDIPYMKWNNNPNVWNHQPDEYSQKKQIQPTLSYWCFFPINHHPSGPHPTKMRMKSMAQAQNTPHKCKVHQSSPRFTHEWVYKFYTSMGLSWVITPINKSSMLIQKSPSSDRGTSIFMETPLGCTTPSIGQEIPFAPRIDV